MRLLIVEDDEAQIQSYTDVIESYNRRKPRVDIIPDVYRNLADGKSAIENNDYDASIIDLKLSANTTDIEGIQIVDAIIDNLRFPVFIVSGSIAQVDKEENAFFKKRSRDAQPFRSILEEIVAIYDTGITKILNNKGTIEQYLNNIFWNHLSRSMDNWINDSTRNTDEKQKSLLRYTLIHMQEHIDEDVEKYHPSEFYITKPIKQNLFTGDIVSYKDKRYIVLTPSCDMVLRKNKEGEIVRDTDMVLFCQIKDLENVVKNYNTLNLATGKNNKNKQKLMLLLKNKKNNYHFIPKSNSIKAGLIDFQDKLTILENDVNSYIDRGEMKRIATVSMPFLKDIISRYSNYYARQGAPDFDADEIYNSLFE